MIEKERPLGLQFHDISHAFGGTSVLKGVGFTAQPGEITCLLGPSGCGKTTLLRIAAGLLPLQQGALRLNGDVLALPGKEPPPEQRPIGLVFQESALFPHMSVANNIAFGLTMDRIAKKATVEKMLDQVGLSGFGERFPHTLSGGQQQRVALARALAPEPKVLLLDEPYANIDSQLRRDLREEARRTLKGSGTVAILVTHDPQEAMEMADQIAVLEEGKLVQAGTPDKLYDTPASAAVAKMFGGGQGLPGIVENNLVKTDFGAWKASCLTSTQSGSVDLVIRPDALDLIAGGTAKVVDRRSTGSGQLVFVAMGGSLLRIAQPRTADWKIGMDATVQPKNAAIFGFPII